MRYSTAKPLARVLLGFLHRAGLPISLAFVLTIAACAVPAPTAPSARPGETTVVPSPVRAIAGSSPEATTRPSETQAPSSSPAAVSTEPRPIQTPLAPPELPLRAWSVSDEAVYVLDAGWRLQRLDPRDLGPLAQTSSLFPEGTAGNAYLLAGHDLVLAASEAMSRTLAFRAGDLSQIATLDGAGPMALDPGKRLFMIRERALLAYDAADLQAPPMELLPAPPLTLGWVPVGLAIDLATRRLYATLLDASASPPHQHEKYRAYDLEPFAEAYTMEAHLGTLDRPSFASSVDRMVSVMHAKNGLLGSHLSLYDKQGTLLRRQRPVEGVARIDPTGEWIYLLRERGVWVLRAGDLSLVSVWPITDTPPRDLALSPDGSVVYLFGGGPAGALPAGQLQGAGFPPVPGPFPEAWLNLEGTEFMQPLVHVSPQWETDHTAFALVGGYGELYRTTDGGASWQFLPTLTYPDFYYLQWLSISPDYAQDHTLTAHSGSGQPIVRSTDGGESWQEWTPRVAFISDRDGNHDVYTAGPQGEDLLRLAADPAEDANPAWSPAWTRMAFQSRRNGNWDIFTVRADCDASAADARERCDLRQLTDDPADDMLPAWSQDGRQMAFVSTRDGNPEIYVMPAGTGESGSGTPPPAAHRLTEDPSGDWRPAWLPDSRELVFTSGRGGSNGIYRLTVPAGTTAAGLIPEPTAVVTGTADNRDPAVSRLGQLAFLSDRDGVMRTWVLDMRYAGVPPHALSDEVRPEGHPSWIDDGIGWILVSMQQEGVTGIYKATLSSHTPVIVSPAYNGEPAWGPALWRPDPAASIEWLRR